MRAVIPLVVILFLILMTWLVFTIYRAGQTRRINAIAAAEEDRWAKAIAAARWEDSHRTRGDITDVIVQKVARLSSGEEHELAPPAVIESIANSDPDWHNKFKIAKQEAWSRAIDLNNPPLTI